MSTPPRKPTLFDESDHNIVIMQSPEPQESEISDLPLNAAPPSETGFGVGSKLFSLSFWFLSSLAGLIGLWMIGGLITSFETMLARGDILGWATLALALVAAITFFLLLIKQITGLWGLKKLAHLKAEGKRLHEENQLQPAKAYVKKLKSLYSPAPDHAWSMARFSSLETEIMDARELIELADQELGQPLDEKARQIITSHARKVSLVTAIAPGPLIDMAAVALLNLRMIRKIAVLYGINPGWWGQMRLAQKVITHLALTGGLALTGDLIQPLIGTSIAAKISKKFGEGIFNGALTIRLGISAVELTRPIPHIKSKILSFRDIAAASLKPAKSG